MNARCRVQLLGALRIHRGDQSIGRFRTYKAGVLLGYLATYRHRPHPREEICEMLWPEVEPALGRNSLSQCLSSLRSQLEPAGVESGSVLIADRLNLQINPEAVSTDHADFLDALKRADRLRAMDPPDPASFAALAEATALYAGDFMPGYYETWNLEERERLRDLYIDALTSLSRHYEALGDIGRALSISREASIADPLREELHQAVIRYCLATGDLEAAKKQYRILKLAFRRDLGLDPSEETKALFRAVPEVSKDESTAAVKVPSLPAGGALTIVATQQASNRPEAEYELKVEGGIWAAAFSRPSEAAAFALQVSGAPVAMSTSESTSTALDRCLALLELADDDSIRCTAETAFMLEGQDLMPLVGTHPPAHLLLRPGQLPPSVPTIGPARTESALPLRLSRFFGRETEAGRILSLLESGTPMITITGPGGIGKTRLALQSARAFEEAKGAPAHFVDLAEAQSIEALAHAVGKELGVSSASQRPMIELISDRLGNQPNLLVLDNFEQLLPEEPVGKDGAGQWITELMKRNPACRLLATSRKRVSVEGEVEMQVGPLSVPSAEASTEEALETPSVQLFVDRAQAVRPDLRTSDANIASIAEICRYLDGMPLAIELAAARSQVLSPSQILERIGGKLDLLSTRSKGVPERHKTIRSAIDWSFKMLSPELQECFGILSVFRGGFGIEAAEAVTQDPVILDKLADLREFSMLLSEEGPHGSLRFRMLETLRAYGKETLSPEAETAAAKSHRLYFAQLALEAEPHLIGRNQSEWLDRLESDHENILAALRSSIECADPETALKLCVGAWRFWFVRGYLSEGRSQLSNVLSIPGAAKHEQLLSKALNGIGRLAYLQGDYSEALRYHEQSLPLSRKLGDRDGEALALNSIGSIAYEQGDYEQAHRLYSETLAIRRELGEEFGLANILNWLGIVLTDQCRYEEATEHLLESLSLRTQIGDFGGRARSLNSLGIIARQQGEFDRARDLFTESLEIQQRLGDRRAIAALHSNLGLVAMNLRDFETAKRELDAGMEAYRLLGDKWGTATLLANQGNLARLESRVPEAIDLLRESLKIRSDLQNLWGVAYSLQGLGACAAEQSKWESAVKLYAAAHAIREKIGSPLPPVERKQLDAELEALRSKIQEAKFESAWAQGLALSPKDARILGFNGF